MIFRKKLSPHFYGVGVLGLLLFLILGDAFAGRNLLGDINSDLTSYVLPGLSMGFSELRSGHLMLWNPYLYGGCAFLGDFLGLLYPPNYLNLFLPLDRAVNVSIFLHLFGAGLFFYLWSIKRGLGIAASLAGAMVFMLGGPFYLNLSTGHFATLCTVAWLPFLFYSLENLMEKPSWKWFFWGTWGLSMQILAGEIQYVFFSLFVIFLYLVLNFWFKVFSLEIWAVVGGMGLGALGLTAVQWMATWAAIQEGARGLPLSPGERRYFLPSS